jgi:DNA-binding PadR family transcriptional regulator
MAIRERRQRQARLLILGALSGHVELAGWDLIQTTGLNAGRLYVALAQLERTGRITSRWAEGAPPRRRLYEIVQTECRREAS